jgi:hypothetical protein
MYANGHGVPQDDTAARHWLRLSADQGFAAAQFTLAVMYADGDGGLTQDPVHAHMWFHLATSRMTGENRDRTVELRALVAERMTPDQIREARRLARDWETTHTR